MKKELEEERVARLHHYSLNPINGIESLFSVKLDDQQKELVVGTWERHARVAVKSCTGAGKALANYERIHTPTGVVPISEVSVGSLINNISGSTSKVTGVFPQGKRHCYRVNFSNGTSIDCDLQHRWSIATFHTNSKFKVLTLEEILDKGIYTTTGKLKYRLPKIAPTYKEYRSVPVDPYTMGVWLGDGTRCTGRVTNIDQEVWDNINYKVNPTTSQTKVALGLITDLKKTPVWQEGSHTKFIPKEYLENSISVRLEILRGLMDTDGTIDKLGRLRYYTVSPKLRDDFIYLIRSLGGTTRGYKVRKTTHSPCFRIHFKLSNLDIPVFKIRRKEERRRELKDIYSNVYISSVEYIGEHEATCISVDDKDSMYLCENFIPTHNTACLVWMSILLMLTREDCRILITAPSSNQLHRVYHSELLKWASKMPKWARDYLDIKKESFNIVDVEYQLANLVTGSPSNLESLAGGHSKNYIILVDEASGIDEEVFDVLFRTLGSSEDGKMILTSNPVRNTGRFYEIFSRKKKMWRRLTFTAQGSSQVQQKWIEDMAENYGIDSDNYRIGVLGEFGSMGETQFFPTEDIEFASRNYLNPRDYQNFPITGGLDVARFGDDATIFITRQGPAILDITEFRGLSTMEVANRAAQYMRTHLLTVLNVDGIGIGAGVVDRLNELWREGRLHCPVVDVIVSNKSTQPQKYANLRSQLYGDMREWLANGADIPEDKELLSQLSSITYTYNGKLQLQLLNKKDIKRISGVSPDIVDAITLTMATGVYGYQSKTKARRVIKRGLQL